MISIFICEDNAEEREFLACTIEKFIFIENYDMQVVLAAADPTELLSHLSSKSGQGVYFLDVDLQHPEYNGFTLAKQIRKMDPRAFLIFVTTHEEMIFETFRYRLEAMSYITKDNPSNIGGQIHDCLMEVRQLVCSEGKEQGPFYSLQTGDNQYHIPFEEILFFETAGTVHKVILHAKDRVIEFRGELKALEQELGDTFMRVHRSYLVNLAKVREIHYPNQTMLMEDGSICLLSRKGKKEIKLYFENRKKEL